MNGVQVLHESREDNPYALQQAAFVVAQPASMAHMGAYVWRRAHTHTKAHAQTTPQKDNFTHLERATGAVDLIFREEKETAFLNERGSGSANVYEQQRSQPTQM